MARPDRGLAPRSRVERADRSDQYLIKRVRRTAFGFHRFDHYRIGALLYAGQPNWDLLDTISPP